MNGRENEAPVGAEDMEGPEGKIPLESRKGEDSPGKRYSACQSTDHGEEQKDVQQESSSAGGVVPAFSQVLVPDAVQPYV